MPLGPESLSLDEVERGARIPAFICRTCGVQYSPSEAPPEECLICCDPRQYVGWQGQRWTKLEELAAEGHRIEVREVEPGLYGIGAEPSIGIGQRSLLFTGAGGNVLWDVPGFVDEEAMSAVEGLGGLVAVSASHPHFYGVIAGRTPGVWLARAEDQAAAVGDAEQVVVLPRRQVALPGRVGRRVRRSDRVAGSRSPMAHEAIQSGRVVLGTCDADTRRDPGPDGRTLPGKRRAPLDRRK